jgi:ferredoxin
VSAPAVAEAILRLLPDGPSVPLPAGERVLDALDDAWPGLGLPTACRAGNCGACLVAVVAGAELLDPPAGRERETLRAGGAGPGERLGCQLRSCARLAPGTEVVLRVIRR